MDRPAPRVLLVEDDAITRRVLAGHLRRAGHPVDEAEDAAQALELALTEPPPDIVLLDLVLPSTDGFNVLERLRAAPMTQNVPVVVLTALDGDAEIDRAFTLGADDFLRKPVRQVELLARIRAQLRLHGYLAELARKERDAQVVLELSQTLASRQDVREILQIVVRRLASAVNVARVSVVLAREHGDRGWVIAASDDAEVQQLPIALDRYPEIQEVLATGRHLTIDDATTHPLLVQVREFIRDTRHPNLTLVPLASEGNVVGVLFLRAEESRGPLDERELNLCRVAANATVVALRNAREIERLRSEREAETVARDAAEKRLRLLERYADLFMSSADGMVVLDPSGLVLIANPRASEITGWTEDEMRGGLVQRIVLPDDLKVVRALRGQLAAGQHATSVDVRIQRRDGSQRTLSVSTAPVREEEAVLVTFRDVTEDRATARELARAQEFLSSLIESSPDAIIAAGLDGRLLLFNTAAERILGYPREDVLGKLSVRALYREGLAKEIMRRIRGAPEGRLEAFRTEVISREGEAIPIMLSAATLRERGEVVATVGIFSDLRERLKIEERLATVQSQLARTEKQMLIAELSGAAAHELNQPLTAIHGYAEFLKRKLDGDPENSRFVDVILREAERMAGIVRKIGRISRYETKPYVGEAQIIDINAAAPEDEVAIEPPDER
ncbi:MAG: PAS domain S-box protein [Polyangiales bacterium]